MNILFDLLFYHWSLINTDSEIKRFFEISKVYKLKKQELLFQSCFGCTVKSSTNPLIHEIKLNFRIDCYYVIFQLNGFLFHSLYCILNLY